MDEKSFFSIVPKRYQSACLENCIRIPKEIVEIGRYWATQWPSNSIFLVGPYGCGKTYFAYSLVRELFRQSRYKFWPRWYTSPQLDSILLEASKQPDGDKYQIERIATEDVLIIDDVGRETKSDRLRRQYFEILNRRYNEEKPTIMTSNFSIDQLGEIIDGSIASRMQEWDVIEFPAVDLRKLIIPAFGT